MPFIWSFKFKVPAIETLLSQNNQCRFDTVDCIDTRILLTYNTVEILVFNSTSYLSIGQSHGAVSNLMDTHTDPNTSVQPAHSATNQTMMDDESDNSRPNGKEQIQNPDFIVQRN